jgi:hypothetical protein
MSKVFFFKLANAFFKANFSGETGAYESTGSFAGVG